MSGQSSPSAVASAYDRWSGTYETGENPTRDLAAQVLRAQLALQPDWDVLEIGCGTGLNTRYLAYQCRSVLAFDFSAGMLAQAKTNLQASNVQFKEQDVQLGWDCPDGTANLIVCTLVLEHIENLDPIFREAARILRPGGAFFIGELHPFRQLQGGQAQFTDHRTGEVMFVPAHLHDVADYLNASLRQGFLLSHLGEWRDEGAARTAPPRLLSLYLRKRL
ncbi:class I SAM-dependent methyltransferase [Gloeobacter kilaueensis]|uniref:Ubiquinone/menaquinone biosynthesis methyltransferase n=1 Tax=Gloeobacter kilaueensis (strain ATCC BAA-2537 / CCAP 1431/1 / ULC 316 / JS1) TaxID=1183438 RepID=U5QNA4_GLOK1|nr:class I SAM-dependent methyltransferase [Gloeobacter kilaueensis]AGY60343.1 ubiquinone/menaquinone biosynthesis methyltransferase [Gloeobacter kilaueensis JS1]